MKTWPDKRIVGPIGAAENRACVPERKLAFSTVYVPWKCSFLTDMEWIEK
jgi:hypothetical protein